MFGNHLKTAWRNIVKHKVFATINVVGLAIGLACCLLILFWVQDELGYDRFHENSGRIYRIVSDWTKHKWNGIEGTPAPLAPAIEEELPEIESAARFATHNRMVFRCGEKAFYEDRGVIVDPAFFEIFSFPFLAGDPKTAFTGPYDLVISEVLAAKYFGTEDPVGKTIEVEGRPCVVRGVVSDAPGRSTIRFDFASSFAYIDKLSGFSTHWGAFNFSTYLLLKEGVDPAGLGPKITQVGLNHKSPQVVDGVRFRLQPLARLHLDARPYEQAVMELGDAKSVYLFSVIAVFVLLVACMNFVNLATARSSVRAKEVGLRKTIGASRGEIVRQFFGESFLLVCGAFFLAIGLARLLLPAFNRMAGKTMSPNLLRLDFLAGAAAVLAVTGFVAGLYPALVLSGFAPAQVLRRTFIAGGKGSALRKTLVVFQFVLSIILLIGTVVLARQYHEMRTTDLGFDKANIVQIPVKENIGKNFEAVKARLAQHTAVLAVTAEQYSFAETMWRSSGNFDWEGRAPDQTIDLVYAGVEFGFFEALDMTILEGRSFSKDRATDATEAYVLNEEAVRQMGIKDPVGKWFSVSKERKGTIIGVVKNAQFCSFRFKEGPRLFYISGMDSANDMGLVLVKIVGSRVREALAHLRRGWEEFNSVSPFEYRFLDETYDRLYRSELRTNRVFQLFSGLAVFIACLGLLGLASFTAERRTKEIGIRKILGASPRRIAVLISGQMTAWILMANVVAWPVAYFTLNKLLQPYTYRTSLDVWVFLLPSLGAFGLAWLTVGLLSLKAAQADPVRSLRHE
ncbi:MAG: ABC transporter permease [Candidatus Aminicenantes bacterium]|nr:ABC transporter permease [Candidatus Aminicenantes bacterium]